MSCWPGADGEGAPALEARPGGGATERSSEAMSAATSASGRSGMWVAVRCAEVGLLGERGSKVPGAAIEQLTLELEFSLALDFEFTRCPPPCACSTCLLQLKKACTIALPVSVFAIA